MFAQVNDGKLAPRAVKCMFLGYASESKRYQMWCPDSKKVIQNRDVTFNEKAMSSSGKESVAFFAGTGDQEGAIRKVETEVETVATQGRVANHSSREVQATESNSSTNKPYMEDDYSVAHDRPRGEIMKPTRYGDSERLVVYTITVAEETPEGAEASTYTEAISCPSSPNWVLAMQEGMESLHKN